MKVVFMGTPDFSVPTLTALVEAGHQVAAVVTQPDKPKGRNQAITMTPVKQKAMEYEIPVFQPVRVREPEFIKILRGIGPDAIVVTAFGQILPKEVLELPKFGCINVHASLLPKYRGAAPIQYAVMDGEKVSGVTTMMMSEGLDTGDMLEQATIELDRKETGGSLHDKLSALGGKLILSTLRKIEDGTVVRTPQTEEGTCYAKPLKKSAGDIDWSMDALSIERIIRGLNPWPSAYTSWNGKTLKIWEADVLEEDCSGSCGEVLTAEGDRIAVKTGKGALLVRQIQPEGKKRMDAAAFLRGYRMEKGSILERSR